MLGKSYLPVSSASSRSPSQDSSGSAHDSGLAYELLGTAGYHRTERIWAELVQLRDQ
jgi:hypothetical protein